MFESLNQGISTTKGVLVVAIVAAIAGTGILAYQYYWQPEPIEPLIQPPTDEIADWNIYINNTFGYSIKYPDDVFTNIPSSLSDNRNTSFTIAEQTGIDIQIGQNQEKLSLFNWIEQAPDEVSFEIKKYKDTLKEIEVNNKNCIQVASITELQGLPMDQWIHTLIPFGDKVAVISKVEADKSYNLGQVYQKMLSTFKFLD